MPIAFQCPSCNSPLQALEHLVGRTLKCYKCASVFNVPAIGEGFPAATFVEMKKPVVAPKKPASPAAAFAPPMGDAPPPAAPSPFEQELELTDNMMMTEEPKSEEAKLEDSSSASGTDMYSLEGGGSTDGGSDSSLSIDQLVEEPLSEDSSAGSTESQLASEPVKSVPSGPQKSWMVTLILCLVGGIMGFHRFYLGKTGSGALMFFTCGGCYIWTLLDFIAIITKKMTDANGNPLA